MGFRWGIECQTGRVISFHKVLSYLIHTTQIYSQIPKEARAVHTCHSSTGEAEAGPARLHSEALSETLPIQGTTPHVLSGGPFCLCPFKVCFLLFPSVESELCLRFQTNDCSRCSASLQIFLFVFEVAVSTTVLRFAFLTISG